MKPLLLLFIAAFIFISCGGDENKEPETANIEFKPGQLWSYKTRPGEERSTIQILKTETNPAFGKVVHINVNGIKIKNPAHPKGFSQGVSHLPLTEAAVRKSVVKLVQENVPIPDYSNQYQAWVKAVNNGKGGVLDLPVSRILNNIQNSILNRPGNKPNEAGN